MSVFYAGVVIVDENWSIALCNGDSSEIIHQGNWIDSGSADGSSLEERIAQFAKQELENCKLGHSDTVHMVVAVDRLFEYGEEFQGRLSHQLSNLFTKTLAYTSFQFYIRPLDASAYTGLFNGIVVKADSCVSVAANGESAETIAIGERGHMIGDPGSAYWIANKCLRMIYDNADGIEITDYDLSAATHAMNEYFGLKSPLDILKPLYSDFSKLRIVLFYDKLADLARRGDVFSAYLFAEAGKRLAVLVNSLLHKSHSGKIQLKEAVENGYLHLLGVGRVWKNYDLIRRGFMQTIKVDSVSPLMPRHMRIYDLTTQTDAYAAALLAAKLSNNSIKTPSDLKSQYIHLVATEDLSLQ